jgi:N-acetylmuramoyl-L-alanine amidase
MGKIIMVTNLDQALAASGVPYVEVNAHPADYTGSASWKERTRPPSTGCFEPEGILCHHTASPAGTSDQADINAILWGNSSAPGPISQLYCGRSGTAYILAAGRANHGGKGIRPGVDGSCADMNCLLLGIEAGNNGVGEFWPDALTDIYGRVVAALCSFYGLDVDSQVWFHATTGPPNGGCNSKIDPAGPWQRQPGLVGSTTWDLGVWRGFVKEFQGPIPPEPPPIGDDDMPTPCGFIFCNAGTIGHHKDGSTYRVAIDGTFFRVLPGGGLQWVHDGNEFATMKSVWGGAGADIREWNTPVGDPDVFGILEGDKPG